MTVLTARTCAVSACVHDVIMRDTRETLNVRSFPLALRVYTKPEVYRISTLKFEMNEHSHYHVDTAVRSDIQSDLLGTESER